MTDMKHKDRDFGSQAITQRLRNLPHFESAPYEWAEFKARSDQRRDLRRRAAGIAACFALIIAGLAVWSRFDGGMTELAGSEAVLRESWVHLPPLNGEEPDARAPVSHEESASSKAAQRAASAHARAASQWLASLPSEPTVVRVDTRFAVTDLEDRISWLDDLLSSAEVESVRADHIKTLRRERAELVDSLAQVRYAETLVAELP